MKFLPLLFYFGQMKVYKPKTLAFNIEAVCHFVLKEVKSKCQVWKGYIRDNVREMTILAQCNSDAAAVYSLLRCFLWRREYFIGKPCFFGSCTWWYSACVTSGMKWRPVLIPKFSLYWGLYISASDLRYSTWCSCLFSVFQDFTEMPFNCSE